MKSVSLALPRPHLQILADWLSNYPGIPELAAEERRIREFLVYGATADPCEGTPVASKRPRRTEAAMTQNRLLRAY